MSNKHKTLNKPYPQLSTVPRLKKEGVSYCPQYLEATFVETVRRPKHLCFLHQFLTHICVQRFESPLSIPKNVIQCDTMLYNVKCDCKTIVKLKTKVFLLDG